MSFEVGDLVRLVIDHSFLLSNLILHLLLLLISILSPGSSILQGLLQLLLEFSRSSLKLIDSLLVSLLGSLQLRRFRVELGDLVLELPDLSPTVLLLFTTFSLLFQPSLLHFGEILSQSLVLGSFFSEIFFKHTDLILRICQFRLEFILLFLKLSSLSIPLLSGLFSRFVAIRELLLEFVEFLLVGCSHLFHLLLQISNLLFISFLVLSSFFLGGGEFVLHFLNVSLHSSSQIVKFFHLESIHLISFFGEIGHFELSS